MDAPPIERAAERDAAAVLALLTENTLSGYVNCMIELAQRVGASR
jgi:hypothetical protein